MTKARSSGPVKVDGTDDMTHLLWAKSYATRGSGGSGGGIGNSMWDPNQQNMQGAPGGYYDEDPCYYYYDDCYYGWNSS